MPNPRGKPGDVDLKMENAPYRDNQKNGQGQKSADHVAARIKSFKALALRSPIRRFTSCPFLNRISVGTEVIWNCPAVFCSLSISILAMFALPLISLATSSNTGVSIRQGPHQLAWKSTNVTPF